MSQQIDIKIGDKDKSMKLVERWTLDHVEILADTHYVSNKFTISKSEAMGITCFENPSLSVMYPNNDKSPVILSNTRKYLSAIFVTVSNKEYLATACRDDGCLYLWDIESKISKKVFDPKLPEKQKSMIIFVINENTIGYGEARYSSPDQSRRVFILKTDSEQMALSSTLRLFTPNNIFDMCYTEVEGSTPCLLLCIPLDNRIMAVEFVGGKTRWEVGKEQMGENFYPWSICTHRNEYAYVADSSQQKIHLLSASDGTLIKQFDGINYGIYGIFAVRCHDQYLWVEHVILESKLKYAISKLMESNG